MWYKKLISHEYVTCYAQTELAHGSDVSSIGTTATYDITSESFVINTPDDISMKWWPGDMYMNSNHAIVMAKLIINGKSKGVQAFFVQIRSLEDHSVMPGIELGELGAKMAMPPKDQGFLKFNNVSIPRFNMFSRICQVEKDGTFQMTGDPRVLY